MLEGLPCKMYRLTAQPSLMTHCHDYFQIWYVAKGAFHHTVSGERFAIGAGDIFTVSPFTLHSVEIPPGRSLKSTAVNLCLPLSTNGWKRSRWIVPFLM